MKGCLKTFTEKKHLFNSSDRYGVSEANNLATIVRNAVKLDLMLWQQKAQFKFRYDFPTETKPVLKLDPEYMDCDFSDADREHITQFKPEVTVDLLTAPALQKFGTTEGRSYELMHYICRAEVECSWEVIRQMQR